MPISKTPRICGVLLLLEEYATNTFTHGTCEIADHSSESGISTSPYNFHLSVYNNGMSVYTKTGDTGKTSIFGGKRVAKSHPQVVAYGTIDELTSQIGLVAAKIQDPKETEFLTQVQHDMWQFMAILAGAEKPITEIESEIGKFEKRIDAVDKELPKLKRFILPGGTEMSGWFHVLRTTCRRCEREVVSFFLAETPHNITEESEQIMLKYLNRLSDLFFMLARKYAEGKEIEAK